MPGLIETLREANYHRRLRRLRPIPIGITPINAKRDAHSWR